MDAGTTFKLSTTIYPDNAKNKTISYTSSNPIVATVSNDGQILAKHDGETTITVKTSDGNKTANCLIKVQNGNIHLRQSKQYLQYGKNHHNYVISFAQDSYNTP